LLFYIYFLAVPFSSLKSFSPLRIEQLWFSEGQEQFTIPVETYREWVLLGLQKGRFHYQLGEESSGVCQAGDFLLCPPGTALARKALEKMVFYFIRFQWKPDKNLLKQGRKTCRDPVRLESTLGHLQHLRNKLDQAENLLWANHLVSDLLQQSLYEDHSAPALLSGPPDRLMLKASELLRADLQQPLKLEVLARVLHISPFQLSRRFRAAWKTNPAAFRTRLRIDKARQLLLQTTWTTEKVAEACGFENAFYFSRVFSRETGQSPRAFRLSYRI
jgi:AraC-like DNA-binding protein